MKINLHGKSISARVKVSGGIAHQNGTWKRSQCLSTGIKAEGTDVAPFTQLIAIIRVDKKRLKSELPERNRKQTATEAKIKANNKKLYVAPKPRCLPLGETETAWR